MSEEKPVLRSLEIALLRTTLLPYPQLGKDSLALVDDYFSEALCVANSQLSDRIRKHPLSDRVRNSATAFALRSRWRPTPFGLWAGVAAVRFGEEGTAGWGSEHRTVTRLNPLWTHHARANLDDAALGGYLRVNPVAIRRGDRLERVGADEHGNSQLVAVRLTPGLARIIDLCAEGASAHQVVKACAPHGAAERVHEALRGLLRAGFLVSDEVAKPEPVALTKLRERLVSYDETPIGSGADAYRELVAEANELLPDEHPFVVDTALDAQAALPRAVGDTAAHAATTLFELFGAPQIDDGLASWRARFRERYGDSVAVLVVEAIDEHTGLGLPLGEAQPGGAPTARQERLLGQLVAQTLRTGSSELVLDDTALAALRRPTARPPVGIDLLTEVAARDLDALNRGDFTLIGPEISRAPVGASAARFAGIAADLDDVLRTAVRRHLPDGGAEVIFTPINKRGAAVYAPPDWLQRRIDLTGAKSGDLRLDQLTVSCAGDQLALWHGDQRVVPMSHTMLDWRWAPPLARFLLRVGAADRPTATGWRWGRLADVYPFLPRVRAGRVIFAPARWQIPDELVDASDWAGRLADWRVQADLPRRIVAGPADNRLVLDLDDESQAALLRRDVQRHRVTAVQEVIVGNDLHNEWLGGPRRTEVVFSLFPEPVVMPSPVPPRRYEGKAHHPGGQWLYLRVPVPSSWQERVLARLTDEVGARDWFFVRYRDPQGRDELRLRWHVADPVKRAQVTTALHHALERLGQERVIADPVFDTYLPEVARYGGPEAIAAAETVFMADSAACLAVFAAPGPRDIAHRTAIAAAGVVELLRAFDPTGRALRWLTEQPFHLDGRAQPNVWRRELRDLDRFWSDRLDVTGKATIAARRAAAAEYGRRLPAAPESATQGLAHMHCNRILGIDPESERATMWLARSLIREAQFRESQVRAI